MQTFTVVVILCLGIVSTTNSNSTSDEIVQARFDSLPADMLSHIGSRLPFLDRIRFSLTSSNLRNAVVLNDADNVAASLFHQFGNNLCLGFAFLIDGAPPGFIAQLVTELLQASTIHDFYVREALQQAYDVGHCDLIDVLSHYRQTHRYFDQVSVDRASCDNVTLLAALPLKTLLRKHALPKHTFFQVLAAKYSDSGYTSFFKDPAWYSWYYGHTIMSYALQLYEQLNGAIDFEPVPFGHIASTRTMSTPTQMTLLDMSSSLDTNCDLHRNELCNGWFYTFSRLQSVLSPGSEMEFFNTSSLVFRTQFLMTAAVTGRLDWVKFMVEHDLWRNVKVTEPYFQNLRYGWSLSSRVMRYVDVLSGGDPVISVFRMLFHHQMKRLSSSESKQLYTNLLRLYMSASAHKIIDDYISAMNTELSE